MPKLIVVSQENCTPCKVLKMQIENRIDELEMNGGTFEYLDLNSLEDKDTFIAKHKLSSTPSILIEVAGEVVFSNSGYMDVDTIMELVEEYNTLKAVK